MELLILTTSGSSVPRLKKIMSDSEKSGSSAAVLEASPGAKKLKLESNDCMQPKLVERKWLNTSSKEDSLISDRAGSFKIMQFNTLADGK